MAYSSCLRFFFSIASLRTKTFFFTTDIHTLTLLDVVVVHDQCPLLSRFLIYFVTDIVAISQVHHNSVRNPCQFVLMPALKSITRFTLPKQPYMRDGQVTKDFLESVHKILNEWHLIELVLRNVMVLNRINLFVLEFGAGRKF